MCRGEPFRSGRVYGFIDDQMWVRFQYSHPSLILLLFQKLHQNGSRSHKTFRSIWGLMSSLNAELMVNRSLKFHGEDCQMTQDLLEFKKHKTMIFIVSSYRNPSQEDQNSTSVTFRPGTPAHMPVRRRTASEPVFRRTSKFRWRVRFHCSFLQSKSSLPPVIRSFFGLSEALRYRETGWGKDQIRWLSAVMFFVMDVVSVSLSFLLLIPSCLCCELLWAYILVLTQY